MDDVWWMFAYMSIALYLSSMAYVIAPALGYHFDADAVLAAFHSAPAAVKFGTKLTLATPFVFHISNGIRHLVSYYYYHYMIYLEEFNLCIFLFVVMGC